MVKRLGKKWVVVHGSGSDKGKKIKSSVDGTKAEAKAQHTAISMSKARAAGHDLPPPPKKKKKKNNPSDKAKKYFSKKGA